MADNTQIITNYIDGSASGEPVDLGTKFLTKSLVMDMYPSIIPSMKYSTIHGAGAGSYIGCNRADAISSPVQMIGSQWKQVAACYGETLALRTDGTLWVSGNANGSGLPPNTQVSSPVQIAKLAGLSWVHIDSSGHSQAAVREDGTLWTWGQNYMGQMGINEFQDWPNTTVRSTTPMQVGTDTNWKMTIASGHHTRLGIKKDNSIWGWGWNAGYQIGDGTPTHRSVPVQIAPASAYDWKYIEPSQNASLGIKNDGTLWAWGNNTALQFGPVGSATYSVPTQIFVNDRWKFMSTSYQSAYGIKYDGSLWCWGINGQGQLGDGTKTNRSVPVQTLAGGTNWKYVFASWQCVYALKTDGTLWSWGDNFQGGLGHGDTIYKSSPVQIGMENNWQTVASKYYHFVGIKEQTYDNELEVTGFKMKDGNRSVDLNNVLVKRNQIDEGNVWTWGSNSEGQLGNNSSAGSVDVLINTVPNIADCKSVAAGNTFVNCIKSDGSAWAWGSNDSGQIGNNQILTDKSTPVQVGTLKSWINSAAGVDFQFFLKNDGTIWGSGNNLYGQLADNTATTRAVLVQAIGDNYKKVYAGQISSAAIKTDGSLWVWGSNWKFGLGINSLTPDSHSSPVQIGIAKNWQILSIGLSHTIAVKSDGSLWAWGGNDNGCLGLNLSSASLSAVSSPVQIGSSYDWKTPAAGYEFSGAIKNDGTLWMWGKNQSGQLGTIPYQTTISSPVQVGQDRNWKKIVVGQNGSFGLKQDGTIYYWGQVTAHSLTKSNPFQIGTKRNWKDIDMHSGNAVIAVDDNSL